MELVSQDQATKYFCFRKISSSQLVYTLSTLFIYTFTLVEVTTLIQISKLLLVLENFTCFFLFEKYDSKFSKKSSLKFSKFAKRCLFPPYTLQVKQIPGTTSYNRLQSLQFLICFVVSSVMTDVFIMGKSCQQLKFIQQFCLTFSVTSTGSY